MHEEIIHFVWKHNYTIFNGVKLNNSESIEVISPGMHNHDSGPDFFNAKVKIGNTVWAGNVEIHIKASDWNRHNHHSDPAYDSVILHLVANYDCDVLNSQGNKVPTVEIPYPDELEWELQRLVGQNAWIPCADVLPRYNSFSLQMWLSSLAAERLEEKTEQVDLLVETCKGSWEEAFYVSMAHSFGLKVNALPFDLLAKATPLKALAKVKDNLFSIEALLFGQASLLPEGKQVDEYALGLIKEYTYQRVKFGLSSIPKHLWKFMRLRPAAFPTVRIAQFAMLIHKSTGLFSRCLEATTIQQLYDLLNVQTSDYWSNHYTFTKDSVPCNKNLGRSSLDVIILNTVIPFTFAYGTARGNKQLKDKALSLLESMKPEKNNVVNGFDKIGVKADSAFFSQALVQLKHQYCDKRKCLYCQVGANVLLKRI